MSKQIDPRAAGSPNKPATNTNRPPTGPSRPVGAPTDRPTTTTQTIRPTSATTGAIGTKTRQQPAKAGFKMRPLDAALLVLGLLIVGGIIWGGLAGAKGSISSNPIPTPVAPSGQATAGVGSSTAAAAGARVPLKAGVDAPDFTLPGNDGKTYKLSDYKGKSVVMLEFFAPWCPHCQADAPDFAKAYDTFKDKKNFAMFGVSATPYDKDHSGTISMADLTWFRDNFHVPYPLLFDAPGADNQLKVADAYGIAYYPTAYLLDQNGKVVEAMISDQANNNPLDANRMITAINKVIK